MQEATLTCIKINAISPSFEQLEIHNEEKCYISGCELQLSTRSPYEVFLLKKLHLNLMGHRICAEQRHVKWYHNDGTGQV